MKNKIKINSQVVAVLLGIVISLCTILVCNKPVEAKMVRKKENSSKTYFTNSDNNFYIIINGPNSSDTSKLKIHAKYEYKKGTKFHKATTANEFRGSKQEVKLTGTQETKGSFNISFTDGNYKTKLDDGGKSYTDIKFSVSFTKPAHMNGNGTSWDVPGGTHHSSNWGSCKDHATANETKTLTLEISVYNFGLITFDGNSGNNEHIRFHGGDATFNLKRPTRRLTFNANGGSVTPTYKDVGCGNAFGTLPTPTATGYTNTGWFTSTAGGSQYTINSTTCKDLTLYAQWTPNTYKISYNSNGGTGTMNNTSAKYKNDVTLAKNAFKKQYYIFDGWATSANGGQAYTDGQTFSYAKAGDLTLYARWKRSTEKVTVNFDANGGVSTVNSTTVVIGTNVTMPGDKVARNNFILKGWSADPHATKPELDKNGTVLSSNTTYYAIWQNVTGNADLSNVITGDGMFTNDTELEGQNGTTYNSIHDGLDYARPDGGVDEPGYYIKK